jgi:metal-dependent amidase/aminoacylase/carboxypeptidase family protein
MVLDEAKRSIISYIDALQDDLWHIATELYNNPEIAFEEKESADLLTEYLSRKEFAVKRGVGGLDTAFTA